MKNKVKCILLIDDDEPTNFLHQILLEEMGCAEKVVTMESAIDALEYLKSKDTENNPTPDLIFLDINMPVMNGWEFLEEYNMLPEDQKGKHVLVMLTTSINPDDKEKAGEIGLIADFINKPLDDSTVEKLISSFF